MQFPVLAIDCEWVSGSEREYECDLCLVQIANPEQKAFLFDIHIGGYELFSKGKLKVLLENENIIKIFHDCRWDSYALWKSSGTVINKVFDTQIAYAVYERANGRKTPLPISLKKILELFAIGEKNLRKEETRLAMESDPNYWKIRPLTDIMIEYASYDVLPLLTVYNQITSIFSQNSIHNIFKWSIEYSEQHRLKTYEEVQQYHKKINEEKRE